MEHNSMMPSILFKINNKVSKLYLLHCPDLSATYLYFLFFLSLALSLEEQWHEGAGILSMADSCVSALPQSTWAAFKFDTLSFYQNWIGWRQKKRQVTYISDILNSEGRDGAQEKDMHGMQG